VVDYKALLNELLASLKISKKKFAEQLCLSQGNVSDWFNKPNARPSIDALRRIADAYNVNLNWLITGTGTMFLNTKDAHAREDPSAFITLPVVADIAAGIGIEAEEVEPIEQLIIPIGFIELAGPYFCFRVSGISMEPELHTGDYAIVSAFRFAEDYNGAICAFRSVDGLLIKRLVHDHRRKKALLIPLNPSQPVITYDEHSSDIILIGRLATIIRKYT
jgi:SOS-response transcriptional repressor LexA